MLPLKEYFSLLPYLTILLTTSFLFLPRSVTWLQVNPKQRSSIDRPEHPFLTPVTSDPLLTLWCGIVGTGIVISWWSTRMRRWWHPQAAVDQVGEAELVAIEAQSRVAFKRIRETALATFIGSIAFAFLSLLLGAPLDGAFWHTYAFSLHLAILTIWPVAYTLGVPSFYEEGTFDRYRLTRLFCEFSPSSPLERALVYPVVGTLCGAWIGAVPLGLDWDRPWQNYPLTLAFASLIGFSLGGYASWGLSAWESLRHDVLKNT